MSRRHEVSQRLMPAMRALRDAEDWARLELGDEVLADRIRGVHESLSDDVLNGRTDRQSDRWKARLWDRYCMFRLHEPDASVRARVRFLRRVAGRTRALDDALDDARHTLRLPESPSYAVRMAEALLVSQGERL